MSKHIQIIGGLIILLWTNALFAEACTYNEAKLALERGNQIRGLSLMEIAAKDGDKRAAQYIARLNRQNNHISDQIVMLTTESKIHAFDAE